MWNELSGTFEIDDTNGEFIDEIKYLNTAITPEIEITDHFGNKATYKRIDRGRWVVDPKTGDVVCSQCGNSVSFTQTDDGGWTVGKWCQTCGAHMED